MSVDRVVSSCSWSFEVLTLLLVSDWKFVLIAFVGLDTLELGWGIKELFTSPLSLSNPHTDGYYRIPDNYAYRQEESVSFMVDQLDLFFLSELCL
mmetsp:Transcript_22063/g.24895  ORF Transcript_22063/g.24895 Transcript_22063/m.24895 type:complete len:95 (-) Transcript_22063:34-318(-)